MRPLEHYSRWRDSKEFQLLPMELRIRYGDLIQSVFCNAMFKGYVIGRTEEMEYDANDARARRAEKKRQETTGLLGTDPDYDPFDLEDGLRSAADSE